MQQHEKDCVFCQMAKGIQAVHKVYEDSFCFCIHDLSPQAPIHLLLIPKQPRTSLSTWMEQDEPSFEEEIAQLFAVLPSICQKVPELNQGFRCIINSGYLAGQTLFHFHMHILAGTRFTNLW